MNLKTPSVRDESSQNHWLRRVKIGEPLWEQFDISSTVEGLYALQLVLSVILSIDCVSWKNV